MSTQYDGTQYDSGKTRIELSLAFVFLPGMVPMFPLPLVVDFMSLSCDRTCCTLSFFMEFDTESGSIMHQRSGVVPGRVRMRKAMTYEQLEVILQSDTSGAEDKGDQVLNRVKRKGEGRFSYNV